MRDDHLTDGTLALEARRLVLGAGERAERRAPDGETMLYVIAGGGSVSGSPLARESLVWLDPGERYELEAGPGGLELLEAAAGNRPEEESDA